MHWLAIIVVPSLAFAARPGPSASRRVLAGALALMVPIVGLALAALVRRVRGGAVAIEPPAPPRRRPVSSVDIARLGEQPPLLDRLLGDPAERLDALVALSSAGDAGAVATLRWALEHGPSEVVLDAALTLEEIELRMESRLAVAREMLGARDVDLVLAAAEAAAAPLLSRTADPALAGLLAEQARQWYALAREWAPERAAEIDEHCARLELAAGRPRAALAILDRLLTSDGADLARVSALREDAAFAARDFALLSYLPAPLEMPTDLRRESCKRSCHEASDPPRADPLPGLHQQRVPA